MPPDLQPPKPKHGFRVLDLLTILAVLCILAALLLPHLKRR